MEAIRMCVGCGVRATRNELLRVVLREGRIVPDERGNLAGRGAWVHDSQACVSKAVKRKAFARALRVSGKPDTALLENRLEKIMDN